jgi:hypothetical protein
MSSRPSSRRAQIATALVAGAVLVAGCGVAAAVVRAGSTSTAAAPSSVPVAGGSMQSQMSPRPHTLAVRPPARQASRRTASTTAPLGPEPVGNSACSPPPLAQPGAGLVVGRVTAIGDSVMIDTEPSLQADVSDINFDAYVGQQWYEGVQDAQTLRAEGQLGSIVVVELGTNGPIDAADFVSMMQALSGAARVVFVTNFVPDYWQNPNNAVIEAGAKQYHNVAVANWEPLAAVNPEWFYDGVGPHMPIGGLGAQAMARLITNCA